MGLMAHVFGGHNIVCVNIIVVVSGTRLTGFRHLLCYNQIHFV